jgi:hypothetical protein
MPNIQLGSTKTTVACAMFFAVVAVALTYFGSPAVSSALRGVTPGVPDDANAPQNTAQENRREENPPQGTGQGYGLADRVLAALDVIRHPVKPTVQPPKINTLVKEWMIVNQVLNMTTDKKLDCPKELKDHFQQFIAKNKEAFEGLSKEFKKSFEGALVEHFNKKLVEINATDVYRFARENPKLGANITAAMEVIQDIIRKTKKQIEDCGNLDPIYVQQTKKTFTIARTMLLVARCPEVIHLDKYDRDLYDGCEDIESFTDRWMYAIEPHKSDYMRLKEEHLFLRGDDMIKVSFDYFTKADKAMMEIRMMREAQQVAQNVPVAPVPTPVEEVKPDAQEPVKPAAQ